MGLTALLLAILAFVLAVLGTAPFFNVLMVLGAPVAVVSLVLAVVELVRSGRRRLYDLDVPEEQQGYARYAAQALGLDVIATVWMVAILALRGGIV
jgi:hypothetical protein